MNDPHAMNRRLYALDEAAVGPEEAPKRWEWALFYEGPWRACQRKPAWTEAHRYRRHPNAGPLPSLDWHEAPDWAMYRVANDAGKTLYWFSITPLMLSLEPGQWFETRPNPEWFELTRPDYEAYKLSDPHKENRRLYALDEAAVGPEQAYSRWQVKSRSGCRWSNKEASPPNWDPDHDYRRDPDAPPLPSLDWHEAPEWAMWRGRDFDDFGPAWFRKEPPDGGWDFIEPRPNSEWFDLTRPDYEASKEDDMDEYLTGPALHRAIADAQENGERPEVFEMQTNLGHFILAHFWKDLVQADEDGHKIRRKPRMRHLTDMHGQRHEWPEPLQHEPSEGTKYFYPDITNARPFCHSARWKGSWWDKNRSNRGFCFLDDDACVDLSHALIAASGGTVD